MIRLHSVDLRGWKGLKQRINLAPLTYLHGRNGGGKSAVAEALRWVIEGRTSIGKLPSDAALMCSDGRGSVTIDTDAGSVSRTVTAGPDGCTSLARVSWRDCASRESSAEIVRTFGALPEMFDVRLFTALSADKRRAYVMDLCDRHAPAKLTRDHVAQMVREKLTRAWYADAELQDHRHGATVTSRGGGAMQLLAAASDATPADWLATLIATIGQKLNLHRNKERALRATARELSGNIDTLSISTASADKLREDIAAAQADCETIARQVGEAEQAEKRRAVARARVLGADSEVVRVFAALDDVRGKLAETSPIVLSDTSLAELDVQIANLRENIESQRASAERIRAAHHKAAGEVSLAEERGRILRGAADHAKRCLAEFRASDWTRVAWLARACSWAGDCRSCQSNGANVAQIARIAEIHASPGRVAELLAASEQADKDLERARQAYTNALEVLDAISLDEADRLDQSVREMAITMGQLRSDRDNLARAQAGVAVLREREANLSADHARALSDADTEKAALEALPDTRPTPELRADLDARRGWLDSLQAALGKRTEYDALAQRLAESAEAADVAQAQVIAFSIMAGAAREVRAELLQSMVQPFADAMNKFLAGGGGFAASVVLDDRDKGELDIVLRNRDGHDVTIEALSGGEAALLGAALAYAIVVLSDVPLRLLIVEASELDDAMCATLSLCCAGVADTLSNVIICRWMAAPANLHESFAPVACG